MLGTPPAFILSQDQTLRSKAPPEGAFNSVRLDPVRFRYRLQRNRPREVSLRGSVSCKSSSGWDPLGSSSNSVFQYPVFKVPRLVSEGVPRQAARMYTTRFRRRCQRVFREIFPFRPKARRGREKGRGSRRTPSLARSAPRERDDPAFRGLHRSTSGDGGLSCRVRHGTGRSPPPWSRSRGALPALGALRGRPEGRMALLRRKPSFARDRAPGKIPGSDGKSSGY